MFPQEIMFDVCLGGCPSCRLHRMAWPRRAGLHSLPFFMKLKEKDCHLRLISELSSSDDCGLGKQFLLDFRNERVSLVSEGFV